MKEGSFLEALIGNKEQRKNSKILYYEISLIIGAVFFGQGILNMMPQEWVKERALGALGFAIILVTLLAYKIDNR